MEPRTPPQEWLLLSEYVDDQLDANSRAQFEQLLTNRSDLREALDDLRLMKKKLHEAPRLHVPRNFTLNASMVKVPQRKPSIAERFFRFSSAFAAVAAVLTFALVQILPRLTPASPALVASAPAAMMESSAPTEQPMIIEWGFSGGMGGGGDGNAVGMGGGDGNVAGIGGGAEVAPAPIDTTEAQKAAEPTPTPPGEESAPLEPTPEAGAMLAAPQAPSELQPTPAPSERSAETEPSAPLILGIAPAEEQGQLLADQSSAAPAVETMPESPAAFPWAAIEIGLAGLAVVFGLMAFLLHRRHTA